MPTDRQAGRQTDRQEGKPTEENEKYDLVINPYGISIVYIYLSLVGIHFPFNCRSLYHLDKFDKEIQHLSKDCIHR